MAEGVYTEAVRAGDAGVQVVVSGLGIFCTARHQRRMVVLQEMGASGHLGDGYAFYESTGTGGGARMGMWVPLVGICVLMESYNLPIGRQLMFVKTYNKRVPASVGWLRAARHLEAMTGQEVHGLYSRCLGKPTGVLCDWCRGVGRSFDRQGAGAVGTVANTVQHLGTGGGGTGGGGTDWTGAQRFQVGNEGWLEKKPLREVERDYRVASDLNAWLHARQAFRGVDPYRIDSKDRAAMLGMWAGSCEEVAGLRGAALANGRWVGEWGIGEVGACTDVNGQVPYVSPLVSWSDVQPFVEWLAALSNRTIAEVQDRTLEDLVADTLFGSLCEAALAYIEEGGSDRPKPDNGWDGGSI